MGLVGICAGLPSRTVPSAIVHCNQNEAGHQTIKAPSMPCWSAASPWKHPLAFMPRGWWNWRIKSVSMWSYQYENQVNGEFFAYLWVILLYFSLESRLIPAMLELGKVRLFWKLIRLRIWKPSHSGQTGVWEYFPSSLAKMVKYEDGMLIFDQNYIFRGHNVVNFSVWFLQLTVFKYSFLQSPRYMYAITWH